MNWFQKIARFIYDKDAAKSFKEWQDAQNQRFFGLFNGSSEGTFGSLFKKYTGSGLTGAEQEANAFTAEEAQKNRDFQQQMADTTYQRTVADLQAAGLNPALAYGNSVDPTPSGSAGSSVTPGNSSTFLDLILQMKSLDIQDRLAKADIRLKTSQAKKTDIETSWIDDLNALKVRSQEIQNTLTEEQIKNLIQQRDLVVKQIDKIVQEIHESESRVLLNQANEWLAKANAKEILAMLPYTIALTEAKTEAEQAAAFLDWAYHAKETKLLSSDYYDSLIDQAGFNRDQAEAIAKSSAYDYVLHSGAHLNGFGSKIFHGLQNLGEATSGLGAIFGLAAGVATAKIGAAARGREKTPHKIYNSETGEPYTVWR